MISRPRLFAASLSLLVTTTTASAGGLRVETRAPEPAADGAHIRVPANVTWRNSWRNARNHDAVWIFAKVRGGANGLWRHAAIQTIASGTGPGLRCDVTADRIGAFCSPATTHRGDVTASLTLTLDLASLTARDRAAAPLEARVYGIEMVYIPAGPFSVGNPDPRSADRASFYKAGPNGAYAGAFRITSEAPITVAPSEGALFYQTKYAEYEGDRSGPIPADFPKGTRAFYSMKYEVLQGQYAAFLNSIGADYTFFRAPNAGIGYYDERGTIRLEGTEFVAARPDRPANWISWDDGTAFADWAGLRPMTELEFVKAARGPVEPAGIDYPWGTSTKSRLLRRMGKDADLVQTGDADESLLTDSTRDVFGASFYWVMDLAGSVWERVVSAGHPKGRAFRGTHGDGTLRAYGMATNDDWPSGDHDGGGYGYKGGGHYELARELARPAEEPLALNPHSPVDWRNYAAWGAAPRSVGYGFRAVRTADAPR